MTPRSKRYFAIKRFHRYLSQTMSIVQVMVERATPIPKYLPGTQRPGGIAMVGNGEPELILHPGQLAIIGTGMDMKMLLPSGHTIPHALIDPRLLEKPVADLTKAIDQRVMEELIAKRGRAIVTDAPFEFISLSKPEQP